MSRYHEIHDGYNEPSNTTIGHGAPPRTITQQYSPLVEEKLEEMRTRMTPGFANHIQRLYAWDGEDDTIHEEAPEGFHAWCGDHHAWHGLGMAARFLRMVPLPQAKAAGLALGAVNMLADRVQNYYDAKKGIHKIVAAVHSNVSKKPTKRGWWGHHALSQADCCIGTDDVMNDTLGRHFDAMIGTNPSGAPPGFYLRRYQYTAFPSVTATGLLFTYRPNQQHRGLITAFTGETTRKYKIINADCIDATDGQFAAAFPHVAQDGDYIIATILRVIDTRSDTNKNGVFSIGLVPCTEGDPFTGTTEDNSISETGSGLYGMFTGQSPSASINDGKSIGGSLKVPAAGLKNGVAITHITNDCSFWSRKVTDQDAFPNNNDRSTPLLAIALEGITANDSPSIQACMTSYVLSGIKKVDTVTAGPSSTHSLTDLNCLRQDHFIYHK